MHVLRRSTDWPGVALTRRSSGTPPAAPREPSLGYSSSRGAPLASSAQLCVNQHETPAGRCGFSCRQAEWRWAPQLSVQQLLLQHHRAGRWSCIWPVQRVSPVREGSTCGSFSPRGVTIVPSAAVVAGSKRCIRFASSFHVHRVSPGREHST